MVTIAYIPKLGNLPSAILRICHKRLYLRIRQRVVTGSIEKAVARMHPMTMLAISMLHAP